MGKLQQRLDRISEQSSKKIPDEAQEVMHRATKKLAELLEKEPGLQVGDPAPPFELPDEHGNLVRSAALLDKGPLVVSFFRGHW